MLSIEIAIVARNFENTDDDMKWEKTSVIDYLNKSKVMSIMNQVFEYDKHE